MISQAVWKCRPKFLKQLNITARAALEKGGETIGVNDLHIAAHARSEGLVLVTNNLKEFERVPALETENWISAAV